MGKEEYLVNAGKNEQSPTKFPSSPICSPPRMSSGGLTLRDIQHLTSTKKNKNPQPLPSLVEGGCNVSNGSLHDVKKCLDLDVSTYDALSPTASSSKQHDDALNAILSLLNDQEVLLHSLGTAIKFSSSSSRKSYASSSACNITSTYHKSSMKRKVEADVALMMEDTTRKQLITLPEHYSQDEGVNLKHMALYWIARSRFEACHNKIHCAVKCLNEGKNAIWRGMEDGVIGRSDGIKEIESLEIDMKRLKIRINDTMQIKIEPDLGKSMEKINKELEERSQYKVVADVIFSSTQDDESDNIDCMKIEPDQGAKLNSIKVEPDQETFDGAKSNGGIEKIEDRSHDKVVADAISPSTQDNESNNIDCMNIEPDQEMNYGAKLDSIEIDPAQETLYGTKLYEGVEHVNRNGREPYATGKSKTQFEDGSHNKVGADVSFFSNQDDGSINFKSIQIEPHQEKFDGTKLNERIENINHYERKFEDSSNKKVSSTQGDTNDSCDSMQITLNQGIHNGAILDGAIVNNHNGRTLNVTGKNRKQLENKSRNNLSSTQVETSNNLGSIVELIPSTLLTPVRRSARIKCKSMSNKKKVNKNLLKKKENLNPNSR